MNTSIIHTVKNSRVNEIDLLRFCAVIAVILFHYAFRGYAADNMSVMSYPLAPIAKYGYLGVHLFFIISGFVILMTAGSGSFRNFVISRIVRLYPAFWVCCTITFAGTMAFGAPYYHASLGQYLVNMTMMSDFVGVDPIDGVYWSLFVEIRFYAFVAAILAIGKIHKAQLFLIVWLAAAVILDVLHIGKLRITLIVDYAAYFIAGATFFLVWSQGFSLVRLGMITISWGLGLYETIRKLPEFEKHYHSTIDPYIVAGIITTFFALMFAISLNRTGYFRRTQWLLAGAITYPLYLLHQNIGFMAFNLGYPAINRHLLFWGTIIGSFALAYAVNVLVEKRYSSPMKLAINNAIDFLPIGKRPRQ